MIACDPEVNQLREKLTAAQAKLVKVNANRDMCVLYCTA